MSGPMKRRSSPDHNRKLKKSENGKRRYCVYVTSRGDEKEKVCGMPTGVNYFFCPTHLGMLDDYEGS